MILDGRKILLIAGPCSAESPQQLFDTVVEMHNNNCVPDIFRAGVWKIRTDYDAFEGFGIPALKWLSAVKTKFKIPVATEILIPKHVEFCLDANIDYIWLGARTVVNSYMVKEICSALKGISKTVMVKNPVNPDIKLWCGAIERVKKAGVNDVIAIHRGFSTYYYSPYRNMPLWEIPNELRRIMPDIPLICDPSHISGKPDFIRDIMQYALDLEMNGLIVETHINPQSALSDKEQQITPKQLTDIISKLIIRTEQSTEQRILEHLRDEIDSIDNTLLEILARRLVIIQEMGKVKKKHKLTILQSERHRHVFSDRMKKGNKLKINPYFMKELLKIIHNEAVRIQMEIMNK